MHIRCRRSNNVSSLFFIVSVLNCLTQLNANDSLNRNNTSSAIITGMIVTTSTNHFPRSIHFIQDGFSPDGKVGNKLYSSKVVHEIHSGNMASTNLPILGSVINIFPRYGYESFTMRVVPRNDSENWLFHEPFKRNIFDMTTIDVHENIEILPTSPNNTSTFNQEPKIETTTEPIPDFPKIHNDFHVQLCEDIPQLLQAYFRYFSIEGFDRPWHAFSAGWGTPNLVKFMGIESIFTNDTEFFYLFVRISMVDRIGQSVPKPNLTISSSFRNVLSTLRVGDYSSATKFFNDIGTHYISSYQAGNTLFQVFVYDRYGYEAIKAHLIKTIWSPEASTGEGSYTGTASKDEPFLQPDDGSNPNDGHLSTYTLSVLYYWVKHIGKIMILNSRTSTVESVRDSLGVPFSHTTNASIFKLYDNTTLFKKTENMLSLESEGLIGLELKSIGSVFHDETQKEWFLESLQNTMNLWESNL